MLLNINYYTSKCIIQPPTKNARRKARDDETKRNEDHNNIILDETNNDGQTVKLVNSHQISKETNHRGLVSSQDSPKVDLKMTTGDVVDSEEPMETGDGKIKNLIKNSVRIFHFRFNF